LTALIEAQAAEIKRRQLFGNDACNDNPAHGGPATSDSAADDGHRQVKADRPTQDDWQPEIAAAVLVSGHARRRWLGAFVAGLTMPVAVGGAALLIDASSVKPVAVVPESGSQSKSSIGGPSGPINFSTEERAQVSSPIAVRTLQIEKAIPEQAQAAKDGIAAGGIPTLTEDQTKGFASRFQSIDGVKAGEKQFVANDQLPRPTLKPLEPSGEATLLAVPPANVPSSSSSSKSRIELDQANPQAASAHPARVIRAVNLRAGPDNGAAVLTTIPDGGAVEVIECRHWCEVVFAGQRGWVYKSFLGSPVVSDR
jgi:hypothetical protein